MRKDKLRFEELKLIRVKPEHASLIDNFQSYENELKDFLVEDALNNQRKKISATFLVFHKENLTGYLTLLTDTINLEADLKRAFRNEGVPYSSLPALKVGRLCVDDRYLKRGIGTFMLHFAHKSALEISEEKAGCRFLVLDAKRNKDKNKDAIHFYKRLGFKTLKQRKKGTTPMCLNITIQY